MQKKYVANKAILVNSEGKILLVNDSGEGDHANAKGHWDMPGGRMDINETPQQGLAREIKEELGIIVDTTKLNPFYVEVWGVGGDIVNEPVIGLFYIVDVDNPQIVLSSEHTKFQWFDPAEAAGLSKNEAAEAIEAYRHDL